MPCLSDFNHSSCSKKNFFFLASFTEENFVLTYWWWHFILSDVNFGGAIFSNWPFVNSNQTKCLSLTKLHFQIYLLWRYGMMMIMRWKKFLGIKKKKLNYLLLLWTFFAPSTRTWTWNCFKHKYKYTRWSQSTLIEEFCMKRVTR